DEALRELRKAIELSPKDASSQRRLALALLDLKRPGDEFNRLRSAAEQDPSAATAFQILGIISSEKNKPNEAVACYRRAIELGLTSAEVCGTLGLALLQDIRDPRKTAEAAMYFEKGLELDPEHTDCRYGLGRVRQRQNRVDEAVACFRTCLERRPDYSNY